jgi:membrane protein implicated in regulation of membrane protease activity
MTHPFPFRKVYGPAIMIAVITMYGLLSALFGDGLWDELSWVALAVPLAVIVWKYSRGTKTPPKIGLDRVV